MAADFVCGLPGAAPGTNPVHYCTAVLDLGAPGHGIAAIRDLPDSPRTLRPDWPA